ncbi:hypothetical protein [Metabacillus sp. RGM 3146]|uniref:hypothetical protein n=1 Tax=Metabacillus sp. RGM 3146 TaxID=3401092 RepID=UPI003B9CDF08
MKFLRVLLAAIVLGFVLSYPALAQEGPFENLGPQVQYVNVIKGKAGVNAYGQPIYYALLQGEPAKLVVMDLQSQQILDMKELEGAKAAWSIEIAPDHTVWIGSTPNEHVYHYNPESKEIKDIGKATENNDSTIWDMTYDTKNNRLFGVTSYGGRVFTYDEKTNDFKSLGQVVPGKQYARSVVYDEEKNVLYVGVGSPASLIKWDLNTGVKTDILPDEYKKYASVYDLDLTGGKLFAKIEGKPILLDIDTESGKLDYTLNADSRGISNVWNQDSVFYGYNSRLYQFDYRTGTSNQVESNFYGASAVSMDIVSINGQPSVVGLAGNGGRFYNYNILQNRFTGRDLKLPSQSVEIYRVGNGVNGSIYSSGFIAGKLGVYDPKTDSSAMFSGLGQVEGFAKFNNSMYFGVYPNGLLYEFDTTKDWQTGKNPKQVLNLSEKNQDRPVAIVPDESKQVLYIGTMPKRGGSEGMLAVYDLKTKQLIKEQYLPFNQSVASMTMDNTGKLYIGTGVYNGNGTKSDKTSQLYMVDTNDPDYRVKNIDLPGGYFMMVSALQVMKDGRLWGIIDNKLLMYDPKTDKTLVFPILPDQVKGMFKNESLLAGKDGNLYGTLQGVLFKVNPDTFDITRYNTSDVFHLADDENGNLYYNSGSNLWKVDPTKLSDQYVLEPGQFTIPNIAAGTSPVPVARGIAKQPLIVYKKNSKSMIPVRQIAAKKSFLVYGTYNNYYDLGNDEYIYNESHKISTYIGRVFTLSQAPILKPDGSVDRIMKPGEEIKVYNYDSQSYDVGNGYKIMKSSDVTYYVGSLTLKKASMLYEYGSALPPLSLNAGEEHIIYKTAGSKMDIVNGYYIEYDKDKVDYVKN